MGIIQNAMAPTQDIDAMVNSPNIPTAGWAAQDEKMPPALLSSDFWSAVGDNAKKFIVPHDTPTTNGLPSRDDMAKMKWEELFNLRKQNGLSKEDQNYIAPYEHQAYAREQADSPYHAAQQAVLTLGYTPAKAILWPGQGRSDPSLNEIGRGLLGAWQGLTK